MPAFFGLGRVGDTLYQDLKMGHSTDNAGLCLWLRIIGFYLRETRDQIDWKMPVRHTGRVLAMGRMEGGGLWRESKGTESMVKIVPAAQAERCTFRNGLATMIEGLLLQLVN